MKKIEIKKRITGEVLFATEVPDDDAYPIRTAIRQAILADADLARADLARAYLADADLAGANLAGANLAGADLAGADLARADLARADLAGADLAGAYLARAYLAGANLADADLARAYLADADLAGAYLAGAKGLDPSAPRTDPPEPYRRPTTPDEIKVARAEHMRRYRERNPEVPVVENLDRRILEVVNKGDGQLEMATWHTCETTHCLGGWAVHFAGPAGAELERKVGVQNAAAMIYRASTGMVPHFFASNERALEDLRARAECEAAQ